MVGLLGLREGRAGGLRSGLGMVRSRVPGVGPHTLADEGGAGWEHGTRL